MGVTEAGGWDRTHGPNLANPGRPGPVPDVSVRPGPAAIGRPGDARSAGLVGRGWRVGEAASFAFSAAAAVAFSSPAGFGAVADFGAVGRARLGSLGGGGARLAAAASASASARAGLAPALPASRPPASARDAAARSPRPASAAPAAPASRRSARRRRGRLRRRRRRGAARLRGRRPSARRLRLRGRRRLRLRGGRLRQPCRAFGFAAGAGFAAAGLGFAVPAFGFEASAFDAPPSASRRCRASACARSCPLHACARCASRSGQECPSWSRRRAARAPGSRRWCQARRRDRRGSGRSLPTRPCVQLDDAGDEVLGFDGHGAHCTSSRAASARRPSQGALGGEQERAAESPQASATASEADIVSATVPSGLRSSAQTWPQLRSTSKCSSRSVAKSS